MISGQATMARAPLTGWLQKRKSEKNNGFMRRSLKSANKRFFTLDFEAQMFYYSHGEGTKNLSMPTCFEQLICVESLSAAPETQDALEPVATGLKSSKTISKSAGHVLGRTILGFSGRSTELHGFFCQAARKVFGSGVQVKGGG